MASAQTATRVGGSILPATPLKEYIYLNGQAVAIENGRY
jgi:hypothetical protein